MRFLLAVLAVVVALPARAQAPLPHQRTPHWEERIDKRTYALDLPSNDPLRQYLSQILVRIEKPVNGGRLLGTGFLIGNNLMLTAGHNIPNLCINNQWCPTRHAFGDDYSSALTDVAVLVVGPYDRPPHDPGDDWAVLSIPLNPAAGMVPDIWTPAPYGGEFISVGYGTMRVMSNHEIREVRKILNEILEEARMPGYNISIGQLMLMVPDYIDQKIMERGEFEPIFRDGLNLKIHDGCSIIEDLGKAWETDCYVWQGNSGGPLLSRNGNKFSIHGIFNTGTTTDHYTHWTLVSQFAKPISYYNTVQEIIERQRRK
jgi:hypothetical protein